MDAEVGVGMIDVGVWVIKLVGVLTVVGVGVFVEVGVIVPAGAGVTVVVEKVKDLPKSHVQ